MILHGLFENHASTYLAVNPPMRGSDTDLKHSDSLVIHISCMEEENPCWGGLYESNYYLKTPFHFTDLSMHSWGFRNDRDLAVCTEHTFRTTVFLSWLCIL
jgi:hypothetical protein